MACQGFKDGYSKCNARLVKAKKIIKEMLSILSKENIEGIYEITIEGAIGFNPTMLKKQNECIKHGADYVR